MQNGQRLWCLVFVVHTAAAAFEAGKVCEDYDAYKAAHGHHQPTAQILSGKHILIGTRDSGWDIELIKNISTELGFTYTTKTMPPTPEVGINEFLKQEVMKYDLITDYWLPSADRRDKLNMLLPYIDTSPSVVTFKPVIEDPSLLQIWFTFMNPFTTPLWIFIVFLTMLSGVVLYAIEYDSKRMEDYVHSGTGENLSFMNGLSKSVFLAFALFTGTGGHTPKTTPGRVLVASLGFTYVVILAAYTANLASFMTIQPVATRAINSIEDLTSSKRPVCVFPVTIPVLKALYPDLNVVPTGWTSLVSSMRAGTCDAFIQGQTGISKELTSKVNCDIEIVGQPLLLRSAGWITNLESDCLRHAVDWALQRMVDGGTMQQLERKYNEPALCDIEEGDYATKGDATELGLQEMAGLIVCYGVVLVGSLIFRFVGKIAMPPSVTMDGKDEGEYSNAELMIALRQLRNDVQTVQMGMNPLSNGNQATGRGAGTALGANGGSGNQQPYRMWQAAEAYAPRLGLCDMGGRDVQLSGEGPPDSGNANQQN